MSKKSSIRLLVVLLSAVFATAALVVADVGALAQNANSSGTQDNSTSANTSTTHHRSSRRGRRGRRHAAAATTAASDTGMTAPGEQTDLSGTYTGTIDCLGNTGDATLTINGQQFTLSGASSASGRIVAETTRGYTGATLRFDSGQIVSVRARHNGSRLSLEPVPGETNKCSFRPSGGGGGGRRRGRRRMPPPPPPAATGETTPTEAAPSAGGETTGTSTRTTGRRRGRRRATNANTSMNSNGGTPPM